MGSVGKAIEGAVKGGAKIVTGGMYDPDTGKIGLPNPGKVLEGFTDPFTGLMGGKGGLFGDNGQADAANAQANAMRAQAAAALEAARVGADASKYAADQQLKGTQAMVKGQTEAAKTSALGGVLGAALGANTTHKEIKQWLPHESGAAAIKSWELGQKWNKTIQMKQQGYQDVAINYELSGKNYKSLFSDSQWNALKMIDMSKRDMMSSLQSFGIKSASNPHGVDLSEADFIDLMRYKGPDKMLEIDPVMTKQRNDLYESWKREMNNSGKGLLVDLYENPQLAGSSILSMKGKDPLIDPSLAPLLKTMMGAGDSGNQSISTMPKFLGDQGKHVPTKPLSKEAFEKAQKDMNAMIVGGGSNNQSYDEYLKNWDKTYGHLQTKGSGSNDMINAIDGLTQGDPTKHSAQIKELMELGVIDDYGMLNGAELMKYIPPELLESPEFNPMRDLSDDEIMSYKDQYNKYAQTVIDPKLIREENLGMGITRKVKLNADGTVASRALEGYMTDMTGNSHFVSMDGTRLQEWYDRQSMISGMGPLFPGIMAPVTSNELSGRFEPDFWGKNVMAKPNMGTAGQPAQKSGGNAQPTFVQSTPTMLQPDKPKAASGSTGGSAVPSGYEGAPLSAGGE